MNPEKARNTLKVASQILEKLPITWWLSAGTALGAFRDNFSDEYFEKDTDIDIGILGTSCEDTLVEAFKKHMQLKEVNHAMGSHLSQIVFSDNDIIVDFYFFEIEGDNAVNYNFAGKMVKPLRMVNPPEPMIVNGTSYPMPTPIEEYLEVRYGFDWNTPKPHTVWIDHAANLVEF